jgi:site-specific DNA recombinase
MGDRLGGNDRHGPAPVPVVRCAVYTRKSTEEGLEQEFNSLDAQREAAEAYIRRAPVPRV